VNLVSLSEVLGSTTVAKANYTTAIITVDYSSAEIVYDDGTEHGLAADTGWSKRPSPGSGNTHVDSRSCQRSHISTNKGLEAGAGFQIGGIQMS